MKQNGPLRDSLHTPLVDLADLTDQLGQAWGVGFGEPIIQYIAWAEMGGIFSALAPDCSRTWDELRDKTVLNEDGLDALVCILLCLGLLIRNDGQYALSAL